MKNLNFGLFISYFCANLNLQRCIQKVAVLNLQGCKISCFLPGKFFGKIKNGQKKCPKTRFAKILSPKYMFCDHN